MTDYTALNPANADDLLKMLEDGLGGVSTKWWNSNKALISGYVRSLAEATLQTRLALVEKRISPQAADLILHNQELAFNQTLQFAKYTTLVLGQRLLDETFRIIGWVIYNETGFNLAPALVKPKP
jgi:hypothetical protein